MITVRVCKSFRFQLHLKYILVCMKWPNMYGCESSQKSKMSVLMSQLHEMKTQEHTKTKNILIQFYFKY